MSGKQFFCIIIILIIFTATAISAEDFVPKRWQPEHDQDVPKVAVVLSGGAALGISHIGVLRVLEEAGIPIDMVVGTSMGSLIGALYSAGYSPGDIEEITSETNWTRLFTEPDSFLSYLSGPVIDDRKMLISFNFDAKGIGRSLGFLPDQQILTKLSNLLFNVSHIRDFDDMPIPYRCVAVDLFTGNEEVFDSGRLSHAVRASISIPGIFAPYPVDGNYYIDGGVKNNLPINTAIEMGADIIIAVNVMTTVTNDIEGYLSAVDIAAIAIGYMIQSNEEMNESLADLVISPDLTDLIVTDFWRSDELVQRGKEAGDLYADEIAELAEFIGQWRELESNDPDRKGAYYDLPKAVAVDTVLVDEEEFLPLGFFTPLLHQPFTDDLIERTELRINQIITSGSYESISFGLAPLTGEIDGSMALELNPISANRGRHSLNAGFMFNGAYGSSSDLEGWYISPGFTTSLKLTQLFDRNSYLHIKLDLEEYLISTLDFFMPLMGGVFVEPHVSGGERSYTTEVNSAEEKNIISFINIGVRSGYQLNTFLEFGLDTMVDFQWLRSGPPGAEELQTIEIVPLVVPTISWENCLPSRFVHDGIRSEHELAFSFINPNSWYHRISIRHEHHVPLELNSTLSYDLMYGSFRGAIVAPWTCFDVGGWDGIPGYLPEFLACTDALMLGVGYQQRFPLISEAIGMDSYFIGQFRVGNGYDGFPGWDSVSVRFGLAAGFGLDTILGELIVGIGMNENFDLGYYLLFN